MRPETSTEIRTEMKIKMKSCEHPPPYTLTGSGVLKRNTTRMNTISGASVFTLGNGYIGMRGNFEEGYYGKTGRSVAGNYLNGFFDSEPVVYPEGPSGTPPATRPC